ncbi:hypothetical protein RRM53_002513 [Yersinia ruckeri]|nr:hypothetical protein [Yersinia ruckeri]
MLTITTIDSDIFYMHSLQLLLDQHFKSQKIKVHFTEPDYVFYSISDLTFIAVDCVTDNLLALPFFNCSFIGTTFLILKCENNQKHADIIHSCIKDLPIIYRKDRASVIIDKISKAFSLHEKSTVPDADVTHKKCHLCFQYQLAPQENKVIRLIAKEYTLTAISSIMKKSIKTVYAQKKSAMNKLGVSSNFELYAFLRINSKLFQ